MAFVHLAYTFDPKSFHSMLERKTVEHGVLNLKSLYQLAKATVDGASPRTRNTLSYLQFDEEWLDRSDEGVSRASFWYITILADYLLPAPSLSNQLRIGYYVLERVLPLVGYTSTEIDMLIRGRPLHTLVEDSGCDVFAASLIGVDQSGGWLNLDDTMKLRQHLGECGYLLSSADGPAMQALIQTVAESSQSPDVMMHNAYTDAIEMLDIAIMRRQALFLILD